MSVNFENRTLYHGDNLNFLKGMNSGTIHLIATDPPFKKNRDFHATPDSLAKGANFQDRWSWQDDIHMEWLDIIIKDEPEVWAIISAAKKIYGSDMAAFLCWMSVRLLEMRRVIREDGSIYLHIDHTAGTLGEITWNKQGQNCHARSLKYEFTIDCTGKIPTLIMEQKEYDRRGERPPKVKTWKANDLQPLPGFRREHDDGRVTPQFWIATFLDKVTQGEIPFEETIEATIQEANRLEAMLPTFNPQE